MDHLLRNRRLGSLATPVSNPFFIARIVYFLHHWPEMRPMYLHVIPHNLLAYQAAK